MLSIVRAETTDNIIPREGHTQSLSQSSSFPVVGMGENKAESLKCLLSSKSDETIGKWSYTQRWSSIKAQMAQSKQ